MVNLLPTARNVLAIIVTPLFIRTKRLLSADPRVVLIPEFTWLYPCQSLTLSKNNLFINTPESSMISFLNSDQGRNPKYASVTLGTSGTVIFPENTNSDVLACLLS